MQQYERQVPIAVECSCLPRRVVVACRVVQSLPRASAVKLKTRVAASTLAPIEIAQPVVLSSQQPSHLLYYYHPHACLMTSRSDQPVSSYTTYPSSPPDFPCAWMALGRAQRKPSCARESSRSAASCAATSGLPGCARRHSSSSRGRGRWPGGCRHNRARQDRQAGRHQLLL